jgi:DHA2 family multidrug resistance protein
MDKASNITGSKAGITLAAMLATLMAVLDVTIVNVGINDIRASFGTPLDQISWVSVGYMMANIVVIPLTGFLQRRFGFRKYLTASIILFTIASALCGLAWNLPSLVLFRVLQGIGGGAIIPTAQSLLFARYPREEHGMAGALFGLGAVTGPLLGPTIGGYLIDVSSWHLIFLVNVPFGVLAAYLTWRHVEELDFEPSKEAIDVAGIGLLAVGMASLQYVLEEGNREGWFEDGHIVALSVIAFLSLVTFVVHELEVENPVVELRVFANKSYLAGTGINFLVGVALFSGSYLFSLFCGVVLHYTALDTGLVFLLSGAIQVTVMVILGRFGGKIDGRLLVAAGVLLVFLSMRKNAELSHVSGYWNLEIPLILRSVGISLVIVPLSVISLSGLPAAQRGNATGLFNLTRELGGSIGTALMGTMLDRISTVESARIAENVTEMSSEAARQSSMLEHGPLAFLADPASAAFASLSQRVHGLGMIRAFDRSFEVTGLFIAAAVFLVVFLDKPDPNVKVEGAH